MCGFPSKLLDINFKKTLLYAKVSNKLACVMFSLSCLFFGITVCQECLHISPLTLPAIDFITGTTERRKWLCGSTLAQDLFSRPPVLQMIQWIWLTLSTLQCFTRTRFFKIRSQHHLLCNFVGPNSSQVTKVSLHSVTNYICQKLVSLLTFSFRLQLV